MFLFTETVPQTFSWSKDCSFLLHKLSCIPSRQRFWRKHWNKRNLFPSTIFITKDRINSKTVVCLRLPVLLVTDTFPSICFIQQFTCFDKYWSIFYYNLIKYRRYERSVSSIADDTRKGSARSHHLDKSGSLWWVLPILTNIMYN